MKFLTSMEQQNSIECCLLHVHSLLVLSTALVLNDKEINRNSPSFLKACFCFTLRACHISSSYSESQTVYSIQGWDLARKVQRSLNAIF